MTQLFKRSEVGWTSKWEKAYRRKGKERSADYVSNKQDHQGEEFLDVYVREEITVWTEAMARAQ